MSSFWIVASNGQQSEIGDKLKGSVGYYCDSQPTPFAVPSGSDSLKFGSFDDLIRLTDDMAKYDSQVEGITRRIERMYLEVEPAKGVDPMNDIKIISNTQSVSFNQYVKDWKWDEAKYPKSRGLTNTLTLLLSVATKLDEEARTKGSQYNEVKTAQQNMVKKSTGGIMSRDMIDILTPANVRQGDFVYTEHLTTVIMILPQTNVEPFLNTYESYAEKVVPLSARKFECIVEEDGTEMWRVVLFKASVDQFMKKVREDRVGTCRLFEYSASTFEKVKEQRAELAKECDKQEKVMKGFCKASLSDVMVAWVHVKAMRVFVESTLRFGVPPTFSAFILAPKDAQIVKARQALSSIFDKGRRSEAKVAEAGDDAEEEYYPYVSINFTPFSIQQKM